MLEEITNFSTLKWVLISSFALVIGGFFLFSFGPYGEITKLNHNYSLPEERFSSVESIAEFLERIGPEGRNLYSSFQLLDLLNPILLCSFLILLIAWLVKFALLRKRLEYLLFIPPIVMIGEFWENSLLYLAAKGFPSMPGAMETHQIALYLKFGGLTLSMLCVSVLACIAVFNKIRVGADAT